MSKIKESIVASPEGDIEVFFIVMSAGEKTSHGTGRSSKMFAVHGRQRQARIYTDLNGSHYGLEIDNLGLAPDEFKFVNFDPSHPHRLFIDAPGIGRWLVAGSGQALLSFLFTICNAGQYWSEKKFFGESDEEYGDADE